MGKMVEVDEEELLQNQKLRNTIGQLMKHPKAKLLVQEAHKMVDPNASTPDLDQAKIFAEPYIELEKKFNDFVAETKKEKEDREKNEKLGKLNADFEKGRDFLRTQKYTPEGIEKLEQFMQENGILNHQIALPAFEKMHPPQTPVMPGGTGSWNFLETQADTGEDLKKLIDSKGENSALIDKMAHDAINEVRGTPRR